MNLRELNKLWLADEDLSDGLEIQRRTFYNHLNFISDLLKVVIECDPKDRFRYKIVAKDDDGMSEWLMKSFAMNEMLSSHSSLRDRILLEEIPGGLDHLEQIMEAMRMSRKITFEYQRFEEGASHTVSEADPYCVKLYHQRWYVVVKERRTLLVSHEQIEEMHVYALDRVKLLDIMKEAFAMDPTFVAEDFFRYAFGTRVEKDNPPCTVRLKVSAAQTPYLRTLKLHPSQREVETTADYSIFELNVALTVELYLQILYYGSNIEVLEPEDLRETIAGEVHRMAEVYGLIEPPSPEELEALMKDMEMNDPDFYNKPLPQSVYAGLGH